MRRAMGSAMPRAVMRSVPPCTVRCATADTGTSLHAPTAHQAHPPGCGTNEPTVSSDSPGCRAGRLSTKVSPAVPGPGKGERHRTMSPRSANCEQCQEQRAHAPPCPWMSSNSPKAATPLTGCFDTCVHSATSPGTCRKLAGCRPPRIGEPIPTHPRRLHGDRDRCAPGYGWRSTRLSSEMRYSLAAASYRIEYAEG
jgi:hypothetical protein